MSLRKLAEVCQKMQWTKPYYSFRHTGKTGLEKYECTLLLSANVDAIFQYTGKGSTSLHACKDAASTALYELDDPLYTYYDKQ